MAASLDIVKGADGGVYLVGEVDGAKLVFGHVNPSQIAAARIEQGLDEPLANAETPQLGAYTGPAEDITPSPHLKDESATSSAASEATTAEPAPETAPEPQTGF